MKFIEIEYTLSYFVISQNKKSIEFRSKPMMLSIGMWLAV